MGNQIVLNKLFNADYPYAANMNGLKDPLVYFSIPSGLQAASENFAAASNLSYTIMGKNKTKPLDFNYDNKNITIDNRRWRR